MQVFVKPFQKFKIPPLKANELRVWLFKAKKKNVSAHAMKG
jgi:hypothetical protein